VAPPQQAPDSSIPGAPPAASPPAPWALLSTGALGAVVVAGALYWSSSHETPRPSEAVVAATAAARLDFPQPPPTPGSDAPAPAEVAVPPVTEIPAPAQSERAPGTSAKPQEEARKGSRLADEVALLSRAMSALNEGRAQDAQNTLAEHERKFPRGLLSVERRAARAQALCSLGRKSEAERELQRLSPSSPQAVRARQFCRGAR
jgi:hypothetical protein